MKITMLLTITIKKTFKFRKKKVKNPKMVTKIFEKKNSKKIKVGGAYQ